MDRKDEFKFYVLTEQTFTLEKVLQDNNIQFHNELMLGTGARSQKYYIKNSDRPLLDRICKEHEIILMTDSIPFVEYRFPSLKGTSIALILLLFAFVLIILMLL